MWTDQWECRWSDKRSWRAWRWPPSGRASGSPCCCRWLCRLHGTAGKRKTTTTNTLHLISDLKPDVDTYLKAKADGWYDTEHGTPGVDPEEQASVSWLTFEAYYPHTHASLKQSYSPVVVDWRYQDKVALHQIIFNNHGHTQVGSCQRPQHTDARRKSGKSHQSCTLLWSMVPTLCISGFQFLLEWTGVGWWLGTWWRGRICGQCTSDTASLSPKSQ